METQTIQFRSEFFTRVVGKLDLQDQWMTLWGEEEPPSISIAISNVSVMHKLRQGSCVIIRNQIFVVDFTVNFYTGPSHHGIEPVLQLPPLAFSQSYIIFILNFASMVWINRLRPWRIH